jgi:predicted transcriptional regulator
VATSDPIELAANILSAFVSRNSVPRAELPALFEGLHASLKRLTDGEVAPPVVEPPTPAVSIRKSVTPDYLICLEDGKRFKSLRRHLAMLGMTPEQYRAKWDLPSTYPMVAPNSTAQRSAFAKNIGFGLREKRAATPPATAIEAVTGTIEVIAPEPASVSVIEMVAAKSATVDTIEVATVEPTSIAKRKAKPKAKSKVVAAAPAVPVKRKPGRPRKATA